MKSCKKTWGFWPLYGEFVLDDNVFHLVGGGYVSVSRLVADWSKVNAQKTQYIWILDSFCIHV